MIGNPRFKHFIISVNGNPQADSSDSNSVCAVRNPLCRRRFCRSCDPRTPRICLFPHRSLVIPQLIFPTRNVAPKQPHDRSHTERLGRNSLHEAIHQNHCYLGHLAGNSCDLHTYLDKAWLARHHRTTVPREIFQTARWQAISLLLCSARKPQTHRGNSHCRVATYGCASDNLLITHQNKVISCQRID